MSDKLFLNKPRSAEIIQLDRIEDTQRSILEGQVEILQAIAQLLEDNERDESLEMQHQRFKREAAE